MVISSILVIFFLVTQLDVLYQQIRNFYPLLRYLYVCYRLLMFVQIEFQFTTRKESPSIIQVFLYLKKSV